jgi:REP element-mobilizing transposase RayT
MARTYCSSLFHCVFSTKECRQIIVPELQGRLWVYMADIAREHRMKALGVGGMEDHAHLVLSLPSCLAIADGMRIIKSASTLWLHATGGLQGFDWQEGYGAFSIGMAQVAATLAYIAHQREHHKKVDFHAEFLALLEKHRIEYDPRYVWG